jgi:hypothetical protein
MWKSIESFGKYVFVLVGILVYELMRRRVSFSSTDFFFVDLFVCVSMCFSGLTVP